MSPVESDCFVTSLICASFRNEVESQERGKALAIFAQMTDLVPQVELVRVLHFVFRDKLANRARGVETLPSSKLRLSVETDEFDPSRLTFAALQGSPFAFAASCMFLPV